MGFSKKVKFFAIFYTLFFALPTYALEGRGEKIYNRMLNEFVIEVNQKHGLRYMGGGGSMKGKIKETSLYFSYDRPFSIDEIREVYKGVSSDWLEWINTNDELTEYLEVAPFGMMNIDITLMHKSFVEGTLDPSKIAVVGRVDDNIYFKIFDFSVDELKNVSVESYSELMSQGSSRSE
ncbi:hypothetical protein SCG7109_AA_00450 [Chlamydiales bacterium SCGC AG-110-M15]|nr:hypothetical protein SCG7109_AA_00450 [Chlamydiales bacterium SCGC AG-110-M15]